MLSGLASALGITLVLGFLAVASQWIRADRNATRAVRQSAELSVDQGLMLCEQGRTDRGMLWLARALELAPPNASELHQVIRANLAAWRGELHGVRQVMTHPCGLHALAISADGGRIATGGVDGIVRIWEPVTGAIVDSLDLQQRVYCLAFSPDSECLLAGTKKTAWLWDAKENLGIRELSGHDRIVRSVAFSPDGTRLVTGSADSTARVWNADTGDSIGKSASSTHGMRSRNLV